MALTDILKDIANAIRAKNGEETQYKPSEMAEAIGAIQGEADYSSIESKLSNGHKSYGYYFAYRSFTEAPEEIMQHTGEATNFNSMFIGCSKLTKFPTLLDTKKATDMGNMFSSCTSLAQFPETLDTANCTSFTAMFNRCYWLTVVPIMDTSKGVHFSTMFAYCSDLHTIPVIDLSSASNLSTMFTDCGKLENITFNGVIKRTGLDLSPCSKLTHDSLMSAINALYDWKSNGGTSTYKLTLGSTNLAKLTDAEKAIATEKGWTLA